MSMIFLQSPVDTMSPYFFFHHCLVLLVLLPPLSLSAESQAGAFKLPKGLGATPDESGRVDSYILIKPFQ